MGDRGTLGKTPKNEYAIRHGEDVLIHEKKNMLYLGCHLANDLNYYKNELKDPGRTRKNNAIFHELSLEAKNKIVKGEEIFVEYNMDDDK